MRLKKSFRTKNRKATYLVRNILADKITWYVALFLILSTFNQSLFIVLAGFYSDNPNLWITTFELACFSLAGWAIITVFIRVGSKKLIPPEAIRKNNFEQARLTLVMLFVPSTRILVRLAHDIFFGDKIFKVFGAELNIYILLFTCSTFSLISGALLYRLSQKYRVSKKGIDKEDPIIYTHSIQKEIDKFLSRLSEKEQNEFATLTLQSEKVNRITYINLAKVLWNGLVIALFIEVCVEILKRL